MGNRKNKKRKESPNGARPENGDTVNEKRTINTRLISSMKTCLKQNKRLLIIYGENDRYLGDFEGIVENEHLRDYEAGWEKDYQKITIADSNHEFSFFEWQQAVAKSIGDWMEANF